MSEAPTIEQANVLLPQEEVRRRTSVLQNSLIEGLKLGNNPRAFISAMSRLSAEAGGNILSPSGQMLPDINYQDIPSTIRPGLQNLPSPIGVE